MPVFGIRPIQMEMTLVSFAKWLQMFQFVCVCTAPMCLHANIIIITITGISYGIGCCQARIACFDCYKWPLKRRLSGREHNFHFGTRPRYGNIGSNSRKRRVPLNGMPTAVAVIRAGARWLQMSLKGRRSAVRQSDVDRRPFQRFSIRQQLIATKRYY